MKRKLTVLGLGLVLVLAVSLLLSGQSGRKETNGHSVVTVTQDGKIILVPVSAKMSIVADLPKPATNAPVAAPKGP